MWCRRAFGEHYPFYQVVLWCSLFSLLLAWVACARGHHYYWQFSSPGKHPSCFEHFVFMCNLSNFLFHMDNTSFFLLVFFGEFWQKNYASMCGHYWSKIMGVFLGPLHEASSLTTNIFWWYRPFLYGGLCPICFYRELGSGGFIFMF